MMGEILNFCLSKAIRVHNQMTYCTYLFYNPKENNLAACVNACSQFCGCVLEQLKLSGKWMKENTLSFSPSD